jgi:hypothetical protein
MRTGIHRLCLIPLVVGSALTVAACGSSGSSGKPSSVIRADNGEAAKTGPQVMKDAAAAMTAAGAVHIVGVGTEGNPAQKLSIDSHLQSEGMTMSARSTGGPEEVVVIGRSVYLKGLSSLFGGSALPGALAKAAGDHWVKFGDDSSGDSSNGSFFSSGGSDAGSDTTTISGLAKSFAQPGSGVTINGKVTRASLNGQPVVIVTQSNGDTFSVAATGTPYVLQAVMVTNPKTAGTDADEGAGTLTFSEYGKRVTITAPTDVVDLQKLLKQDPSALFPSGVPTG